MKLREELIEKINIFNEIFELDFLNNNDQDKGWKYYLDNFSKHLFKQSYITFIDSNSLKVNNTPGTLEKYYNLFQLILKDFKTMLSLKIPNQIYCAVDDIMKLFNEFLIINNFKIEYNNNNDDYNYQIFPII